MQSVQVVKFHGERCGEALVVRARMDRAGGNAWGVLNAVVTTGQAADTLEIYDAAASESVGQLCTVAHFAQ